jgi:ribonuclease HI
MARAGEDGGNLISPRTAVHSVRIVKTAAALRGAATVERSDLLDLCFLPGMEGFAANLKAELDAAYERSEAEGRLVRSEAQFKAILDGLEEAKKALSPVKLLQSAKYMSHFADQVANLKVTNEFTERRKRLRDSVADKVEEAKRLAFDNTRL